MGKGWRVNVLRRKEHSPLPFLHTAGWNVDAIPGARAAMLGSEAEAHLCTVEPERRDPDA